MYFDKCWEYIYECEEWVLPLKSSLSSAQVQKNSELDNTNTIWPALSYGMNSPT